MRKQFLIVAAAAALVLPSLESSVLAAPLEQRGEQRPQVAEDEAAYTEARIAALKAGLKLTPAQEKNWPTLEATVRDLASARAERIAEVRKRAKERHEDRDAIENLRERARRLASRAADLEKVTDAAKPLYDSLDEAQKRRFAHLLRAALSWRGHGRWGRDHSRCAGSESQGDSE